MSKVSFHKKSKKVEKVEKVEDGNLEEVGHYNDFLVFEKKDSPKIKEERKMKKIKDSLKIKEKTELISNPTPTPTPKEEEEKTSFIQSDRKISRFTELFKELQNEEKNNKKETLKGENENSKPEFIPKNDSLKTSDTFTSISISTKNDTFSKCDSLKNDSIIISESLSLSSSNIINQNINENSTSKKLEESSSSSLSMSNVNVNVLGNNSLTDSTKKPEETGADMNLIIDKVISCEDTRTTIMIKNIPNKFNRELLLEIIDQHFKGTYDTFVLPTDVNKYKNFGYSFINFTSSYYIPYFYFIFNKKKWAGTNSKKVCELTYSKVQGKNDLSNHYPSKIIYDNKESKMVTPDQKYIIPNAFKLIFNKCFPNQSIEEFKYYFITKMPKNE